ncbi:hypothetical protein ILUMI_22176 [Ignelater luminosus]|uniref:Uncharacterized protein n=1 Tax=Ignelater luminosus TaxID=2038154 RepID=A0A8K0CH95_IGNLU|nr:hypothetical protein ILUMI_22176 [Ignelater luminosus]
MGAICTNDLLDDGIPPMTFYRSLKAATRTVTLEETQTAVSTISDSDIEDDYQIEGDAVVHADKDHETEDKGDDNISLAELRSKLPHKRKTKKKFENGNVSCVIKDFSPPNSVTTLYDHHTCELTFEEANEDNDSRFENAITRTVQNLKDHKIPDIDQVPAGILNHNGKSNHDKLFQQYDTDAIPTDPKQNVVISETKRDTVDGLTSALSHIKERTLSVKGAAKRYEIDNIISRRSWGIEKQK